MFSSARIGAPAATSPTRGIDGPHHAFGPLDEDLDRARLGGIAAQHAGALELGQVRVHGRRRVESEGAADLADRGRVAGLVEMTLDVLEDLALALGQVQIHVRARPPGGDLRLSSVVDQ